MKSRILWAAVMLTALAGFYFATIRPLLNPPPARVNPRLLKGMRPPEIALPPLPEPNIPTPTLAPPPLPAMVLTPPSVLTRPAPDNRQPTQHIVPIQNNATIDFSIGAPVVRSQPDDQAALARALKEMAEATKGRTFAPPAAATPLQKSNQ